MEKAGKTPALTAGDVMNPKVLVAGADWSLGELAEFLVEHTISGAPVSDENDELIGVVSSSDMVHYFALPIVEKHFHPAGGDSVEERAMSVYQESQIKVRDIMTPVIFTVDESTRVKEVADTMLRGMIHRLFVTRENKIVGLITALDLLNVVRNATKG